MRRCGVSGVTDEREKQKERERKKAMVRPATLIQAGLRRYLEHGWGLSSLLKVHKAAGKQCSGPGPIQVSKWTPEALWVILKKKKTEREKQKEREREREPFTNQFCQFCQFSSVSSVVNTILGKWFLSKLLKPCWPDLKNQVPDTLFKTCDFLLKNVDSTRFLGQSWGGVLQEGWREEEGGEEVSL